MSIDWFSSLFFSSKGKFLPELINGDGERHKFNDIRKCEQLRCLFTESFLKVEKRPFIIYNGTHYIKHLDKIFVTEAHKELLVNNEVAFYFFEPLTHYVSRENRNPEYEPHILRINNDDDEVSKLRCLELDSLDDWVTKHNIKNLKIYCTDYKCWEYYKTIYPNLTLLSMDLFVSWWAQRVTFFENRAFLRKKHYDIDPNLIKKKFWSGAWRYDPSRHFITAFLAGRNLIHDNNVSFYFKVPNAEMTRRFWFGWKEFSFQYPALSETLLKGNSILQDAVPLSISVDNPVAISEYGSDPAADSPGANLRLSHDPIDSYYESFCAIVQESRVTQPWPNISEKTLNAIKNYRPFLMCAAPGTLQMLKDMGFKTFDAYWPEDYDQIVSTKDRLARVCEIIDYINTFDIEELKKMYIDMIPILKHNNENIENLPKFYNNLNLELMKNYTRTND